jgi:hypothetical protein
LQAPKSAALQKLLDIAGKDWDSSQVRDKTRPIEGNTKSLHLKSNLEEDFVAAFYFSEAPSPPKFLS